MTTTAASRRFKGVVLLNAGEQKITTKQMITIACRRQWQAYQLALLFSRTVVSDFRRLDFAQLSLRNLDYVVCNNNYIITLKKQHNMHHNATSIYSL